MKRALSILIVLVLCISMFNITYASAVTTNAQLVMGNASGKVGDTVALKMSLPTNPGFNVLSIKINYDNTKIKLIGVDKATIPAPFLHMPYVKDSDPSAVPYLISWMDETLPPIQPGNLPAYKAPCTWTGDLATFSFEILAGAPMGQVPVSIQVFSMYLDDKYMTNVPYTITNGYVDVQGVNFDPTNGSAVSSQATGLDGTVSEPTAPTKTGYTFDGWYTAATGGTKVTFPYTVTATTTLYAHWNINNYTVGFDSAGGSEVTSKSANYNTTITEPTAPTKTGYTFNGWFTAATNGTKITFPYPVTDNATLYAQWTINNYTVAFDSNGGSAVTSKTADYNTTIPAPIPPTRSGYGFQGWYTAATGGTPISFPYTVTANNTFYAQWLIGHYTISFNENGGTTVASQSGNYNTTITEPAAPTKTGYTFDGWYTALTGGTKVTFPYTIPDADTTLYAHWTINNYSVTFNSNGGSAVASQSGNYNTNIAEPIAPTMTGYTLQGWYTAATGGTKVTFPYTVTSNTTLYAQWKINNYTVTFNSSGGSTVASQSGNYNTTIAEPAAPTRTGYTFEGWFTAANSGTKITFPYTIPAADTTLYAQWKAINYTVTFSSEGSTFTSKSSDYNTTITEPTAPVKTGYTLDGWFTAATGGTKVTFPYTVTGNTTLYAQWKINNYTVTFNSNGGSAVANKTADYNTTVTEPAAPTKTGYTFNGWFTAATGGTKITFPYTVLANTTLYAQWTVNNYTVTFDSKGGSTVVNKTADYNTTITEPAVPTKTEYTFVGWYTAATGGTKVTFPYTVTGDTTLYAVWTDFLYTVTFNTNGGSAVDNQGIAKNRAVTQPAAPTKENYTFAGWYKDAALTTAWNFTTDLITVNTTIYAKWNLTTVAVTENGNTTATVTTVDNIILPSDTTLTIANITTTIPNKDAISSSVNTVTAGKVLLNVFDIKLMSNGTAMTNLGGKVKVKLAIPASIKDSYKNFGVVYIAADGTVTNMNAVVENGFVVFETDHFSNYAIVGTVVETNSSNTSSTNSNTSSTTDGNPGTGDTATAGTALLLLLIAAAGVVVAKKRVRA